MNRELIEYFVMYILLGLLILICYLGGCLPSCQYPNNPVIDTNGNTMKPILNSMNWVATLSVLGIGLSVFALLNGNKLGFAGIGASLVTLFTTAAMAKYSAWIAWFAVVFILVGVVSVCIYSIWINRKALKQLVKGAQILKGQIPNGDGSKLLKSVQSKSTQKLVQGVKGQLRVRGEI